MAGLAAAVVAAADPVAALLADELAWAADPAVSATFVAAAGAELEVEAVEPVVAAVVLADFAADAAELAELAAVEAPD